MTLYMLKLVAMLAVTCGLIVASLRGLKYFQKQRRGDAEGRALVSVRDSVMVSPGLRLSVLQFGGKDILVAQTRQGLTPIAEAPAEERVA